MLIYFLCPVQHFGNRVIRKMCFINKVDWIGLKLTEGPGGPTLPAGPGKPVAPYTQIDNVHSKHSVLTRRVGKLFKILRNHTYRSSNTTSNTFGSRRTSRSLWTKRRGSKVTQSQSMFNLRLE